MSMIPHLFILAILAIGTSQQCGERQYKHDGLCCDMCRPQHFVKQHCSQYNDTICEPCEVGTIMNSYNSKEKCEDCPTFHYYNTDYLACMPCKTCGEGNFPIIKCTTRHNAECEKCPENHFSNTTGNKNSSCLLCTQCQSYKRKCSKTMDALCEAVPQTTKKPSVDTTSTTPASSTIHLLRTTKGKTSAGSASSHNLTLLIVTAVVLIFLVLAVAFTVYWCKKKNYSQCQGDGLLGAPRRRYEQLQTGQLLRSQSASFFIRLVELLTPEGRPNWKDLAANFGDFSYEEIANFGVDKITAAERMLCAWQAKNSSTVDKLYKCCLNIKREDVATFIADYVSPATDTTFV